MPKSSRTWPNACGNRRPAESLRLWTIGHANRSIDGFLALLAASDIALLADVRSWPGSRRHPHFAYEALDRSLAEAGIAYRHLPGLGGRRGRQPLGRPSPNGSWRPGGFRNFADYALTAPFADALAELLRLARDRPTAIMCAEADPARCHRRIITDHLLARGVTVFHILDATRIESARITDAARVNPDGVVTYPPQQPGLFD